MTPRNSRLLADRELERRDAGAEPLLQLVERAVERRALAVELVDEDHARDAALLGELPRDLGLHLDALDRGDDEHARSAAWSAAATSPTKSAYPGVSSRLTLWPSTSNGASASDTEMRRRSSSGSKSQTVVPSSTRPIRGIAPAAKSSASASDVLPAPPWPTRATLRILAVGNVFTHDPPLVRPSARPRGPST